MPATWSARLRLLEHLMLGVLLLTVALCAFAQWKMHVQLGGQARANLSLMLEYFVEEQGRIPTGFQEMVEKGYLRVAENGLLETSRPDLTGLRRPLFCLQDLQVNWKAGVPQVELKNFRLIDTAFGSPPLNP